MNRGRVSAQVFLSFLMMMFLMVTGCSSTEDAILNPQTIHKISGRVTLNGSVSPLADVTINLTGETTDHKTTHDDGSYSFENLKGGDYTVTPSLAGYIFDPTSRKVDLNGTNFTATADFVAILGTLPFDGTASG